MASNIHLINCTDVIVNSDVENFVGIGIVGPRVIDNTYSNTVLQASDEHSSLSASSTLDRTFDKKIIYVDATLGDVTFTWDNFNMEHCRVCIIRTDASANKVYIDATTTYGTENYIGNALPYDLALSQYEPINLTSLTDTIYKTA